MQLLVFRLRISEAESAGEYDKQQRLHVAGSLNATECQQCSGKKLQVSSRSRASDC